MEDNYTIVLADGTRLEGLVRNGTNYISDTPVDPEIFENNCSPLLIIDNGTEEGEYYEYADLVHCKQEIDGCYIAFRRVPDIEIWEAKMRSDLDYLAMMNNIDLEEA